MHSGVIGVIMFKDYIVLLRYGLTIEEIFTAINYHGEPALWEVANG